MAEVMTATPTMGPNNEIKWTLCNDNMQCGTGTKHDPWPIVDVKKNAGTQKVFFIIDDSTLGIKFADDPLWVVKGQGQHPNQPGIDSDNQLSDVKTNNGKTILTISDKNDNSQTLWLSYRLNFVNGANQAVKPIDPDWKNGGGGGTAGMSGGYALPTLIIGVATLVAILIVLYQQSAIRRMIAGGRSGPASGNPG